MMLDASETQKRKINKYPNASSSWWFEPNLKNMSQNGNHPQIGMEIENISNHHLVHVGNIYPH